MEGFRVTRFGETVAVGPDVNTLGEIVTFPVKPLTLVRFKPSELFTVPSVSTRLG
jgi:hypothetical protein